MLMFYGEIREKADATSAVPNGPSNKQKSHPYVSRNVRGRLPGIRSGIDCRGRGADGAAPSLTRIVTGEPPAPLG